MPSASSTYIIAAILLPNAREQSLVITTLLSVVLTDCE